MALIHTTITKKDLVESNYYDNNNCALAKTLKRVTYKKVIVGGTYANIDGIRYKLLRKLEHLLIDMCSDKDNPQDIPIVIDNINKTISIDK